MSLRVLLTTCSFQDTPGAHHELLASEGYEIVRQRGPLTEEQMLDLAGDFDAFLCGDDEITQAVLEKSLPRLKVISKYGIGVDKIDISATKELGIPVLFTPGVNHMTVAEHVFCLALALYKNLIPTVDATRKGEWKRMTGHELWQKKIGIIGMGRIGREVAKRAKAFDMEIHGVDPYWPEEFCKEYGVTRHENMDDLFKICDVISPHTNLTEETHHMVNKERLAMLPKDAIVINTGRGALVDPAAIIDALDNGDLWGYAADVMEQEPPEKDDPLLSHPKVIITSHVGSRTYESVPRQALKAVHNLVNFMNGGTPIFCVNGVIESSR